MRHRKSGTKLNMSSSHRQAMFRNMVTSLLKYDRIKTTDSRAKELRSWADHIITLAKRGDLHARRQALAIVREKDVVHKLFEDAPKRFGKINGGYTRITKIGRRPGDAARIAIIELIEGEVKPKAKKAKPAAKKDKPVKESKKETVKKTDDTPKKEEAVEATAEDSQSAEKVEAAAADEAQAQGGKPADSSEDDTEKKADKS